MREHDQQRSDQPASGSGFNRRDFLKGSGAAVAATALVNEATEAQAQDNKVASGAVDVTLNVNGKQQTLKLEPRTTLLDALRDDLNLTGCKEVCDTTNCGACTVMIDGKATYACTRLAVEVQGREIKTVESLRQGDNCDEVIDGCTPGFVVATRAFLNKNPNASLEEIQKGLGGNLCRCGTYNGITACALELAKKGGA